jgi:hypothetical protein
MRELSILVFFTQTTLKYNRAGLHIQQLYARLFLPKLALPTGYYCYITGLL